MADYASEGGHYYRRNGSPCYTLIGKNGRERNCTIKDAREMQLVPGVTSVINCASKPALTLWLQKQAIMAALTLPRMPGEPEEDWLARVLTDSKEEGKAAADKGTLIHAALEQAVRGLPYVIKYGPWISATITELERNCGDPDWQAERSHSHPAGYGCKIDLHSDEWVIDFKTKEGPLDGKLWDEHLMQLSANRRAARKYEARCAIMFVRRDQPEALFVEIPEDDLMRGLCMFDSLLAYWKAKNKYESGWQE